jgi:hypothetical protein
MDFRLEISGDLKKILDQEADRLARSFYEIVEEEGEALKEDLRSQIRAVGFDKSLEKSWQMKMYPRGRRKSISPAAFIYSKTPDIHFGFDQGAFIRPTGGGRYLAIPTNFNRLGGRRAGKPRISPQEMMRYRGMAFTRPGPGGVLYWFLKVTQASDVGARRSLRLYAGGDIEVGTGKHKRAWKQKIVTYGAVPMFVLVPQVKLPKVLNIDGAATAAQNRIYQRLLSLGA